MMRALLWLLVLGALGAGGWYWWTQRSAPPDPASYRTVPVTRTDVVSTISASGTIVPEDVVDVGTQVNGQIASFGTGTDGKQVDYRSTVTEGQVLARIDDTLYAADVAAGEAQLSQANAQVLVARANLNQAQAKAQQTERDWQRAQKLGASKALSQADYDLAKSAAEQAAAGVGVAEASISQAEAAVKGAEASLLRSRRNLTYCTIKSPVSGVVIDRRVEIGQTVVSSLNAPSLFLLAKDLSRMQVLVQVNEADIGRIKPGQQVTFTTDAFPAETFEGEVRKVRLNATMTQNVVTYTVEIVTGNENLKLLPYLTANVKFTMDRRDDVLAVPNAALRWSPPGAEPAASAGGDRRPNGSSGSNGSDGSSHPASRPERPGRGGGRGGSRGTVWVLDGGQLQSVSVRTGLSDGTLTEVTGEELREGAQVVVGEQAAGSRPGSETSNPFAPQSPFGGRRR